MDKQIITFSANEQNLVRIGGEYHYSSNKVSYIGAHFDLGANWDGFDSVRAVWFTDCINGISTVLDGEGNCTVPTEVLKNRCKVMVNLVGSIVENDVLTDRLTSYPITALVVDANAKVEGTETAEITPSQFEQFVSIVQDAVANIKDIVSTTLNADYTLTFVYSDGTSYTTPSIRGERGPQGADGADGTDGNGIASAVLNSNYTLTLTFTDGTSYTTPSIRGAQGPKGDPGDVSQAQLDAAVSDLKSDLSDFTVVSYSKNRFDVNAIVSGRLNSSGQVEAHSTWTTSDYCYVKGFSSIFLSGLNGSNQQTARTMFYLCTYNDNKGFIEKIGDMPSYPVNLSSNVAYVRFCFNGTPQASEKIQLEEGSTFTSFVPYNREVDVITDTSLEVMGVPADSYAVGQRFNNIQDIRLYNSATQLTMTANRLLNADTGVISETTGHTNYQVSDFVEVESNSKVMITTEHFWGRGLCAFYDENKIFISGYKSANGGTQTFWYNKVIPTPVNAKYIVIALLVDRIQEPYLFEGIEGYGLPSKIWDGYKWTCIGDSLTAYGTATAMHYFDYIAGATGIEIYNMGVGGTGYAQGTDNFRTRILNVPTDSDVVTIFGSGNDGSSGLSLGTATDTGTTTIGGIINTTIDNFRSIMPVGQLGIITPTPWVNNTPEDAGWMENYSKLIVEICALRGVPCLDLFHCSNLDPNDSAVRNAAYTHDGSGGVHPDEVGHKVIASRIKGFLETLLI